VADGEDILDAMTRCVSALVAIAILALAGMPTMPDSTDGSPATCSSQIVADVEVDNCVAGPDVPVYGDAPRLGVELGVGSGAGAGLG
jgi:hypothetical protein